MEKSDYTFSGYVLIILNGWIDHRDFLADHFYREYNLAEKNLISFEEFFQNLIKANQLFLDDITRQINERKREIALIKTLREKEGNPVDDLQGQLDVEFSVHLMTMTNNKFIGQLWGKDIGCIHQAIIQSMEKIADEAILNKLKSLVDPQRLLKIPPFQNNFDSSSEIEVYEHFAQLVQKKYLTEDQLKDFIKSAFDKREGHPRSIIFSNVRTKQAIIRIFYSYYKDVAGKPPRKKDDYVRLLSNYFRGYDFKTVKTNFSK
jgi:hypothetical protein